MTPLDIKKQTFTRKWQGLDPGQVEAFLERVAREFEELNRQNMELQERVKASEERLHHFSLIEKTLQDTAITLQKTLEEKRKFSEQEGELILQQARQHAEEESRASREQAAVLRSEIQALEGQRREFFMRMRSLLQTQSQALEALQQSDPVA